MVTGVPARFKVADFATGKVRGYLPLTITSPLVRLLQNVGTGGFELHITDGTCPVEWERWTRPWRSLILAVDDSDQIVWPGVVAERVRTHQPVVGLKCVTPEGYLDRRYVPDLSYTDQDQTSVIAAGLADLAATDGIALTTDCAASGVTRDRNYLADEDATVLERLQLLAAVQGGFEWTVAVEWTDVTHTAVGYVFRTGYPTLGVSVDDPALTFECPGSVEGFTYTEPGPVTHVTATGDGTTEERAVSTPVVDTDYESRGWPRIEEKRAFSGVIEQDTIDAHAEALAEALFGTSQSIATLDLRMDEGPRFGSYALGDSARFRVELASLSVDEVWRVIGWRLASHGKSVSPMLARWGV